MKAKYVIFDLDDTLMYEIDYLKSAYQEIAFILDEKNQEYLFRTIFEKYQKKENVFEFLTDKYQYSKDQLLKIYRNHFPHVELDEGVYDLLKKMKSKGHKLGLITDGRSTTQRNKLNALGIERLFDRIIVSEEIGTTKPDERNFKIFIENDIEEYFYIADNTKKDFVTPNKLGWTSICLLDKGNNIHQQDFSVEQQFLPQFKIIDLYELENIIK